MKKRAKNVDADRRVRRTRAVLRTALIDLVLKNGWDSVSVMDVCARADVGRSTFYAHFVDKEDLLLSGFDALHAELRATQTSDAESFAFVDALMAHVEENVKLVRVVLGRKSGQAVQRRFREVVTRIVDAELESMGVGAEERPLVARYVSGGLVEMIFAWIEGPIRADAREIAGTFRTLTRKASSAFAPLAIRPRPGAPSRATR
jgi:AcrR family transcriptional regulator